jgi:glycosyltransferase involved in cell wall biosynthesis
VKILVVSSYPPRHCGVGAYARAHVDRLREQGHRVVVLSPRDGDGDMRTGFFGGRPFYRAARLAPGFDRVLVHYEPALYSRTRAPISKIMASVGLLWLALRVPHTEILVHEAPAPTRMWRPDHLLLRPVFARAHLFFHTQMERDALERAYRLNVDGEVIRHVDAVQIHQPVSRREARSRLGLDPREPVLLCAGFLHQWKGFDRAVRAFERAGTPGRLFVVGSIRLATPRTVAYARQLRQLCDTTPNVTLVEEYVSDGDFDAWIAAADVLLLPYVRAWSSGALARAQQLGTPAIVSAVGGLPEQAGPDDQVFHGDDELAELLARLPSAQTRRQDA